MNSKKKIFYFLFSVLILVPLFYCMVSVWYSEDIVVPQFGKSEKQIFLADDLRGTAKDFEVNNENEFISTSDDPWFEINTTQMVRTIIIDIDKINNAGTAQIFYCDAQTGLNDNQIITFVLKRGKNYIQIPDGNFNYYRLDLTGRKNQTIKINKIVLSEKRRVSLGFLALQIIMLFLEIIGTYIILFKKENIGIWLEKIKYRNGEYKYYRKILLLGIAVTSFIVYGAIIIRGHQYMYYDIGGGDEPEAYIPLFVSYINQIKSGTLSSWTFFNGLGTSTTAIFGFLLNPFLLLVFLSGIIFGISTINTMLLVAQLLNIVVCGLLCYKYLDNFKGSYFSKAIASYICAFNGYMILYAQHYVHSDFCFYLLVILILIEKIKKSRRSTLVHIYFALCCAILFCASIYIGYMIGLFVGIYTIFRMLQEYQKNEIMLAIRNLFRMLVFAVLGVMLAMPVIIPVANELLFNSTRITGDDTGVLTKIKTFLVTPYPVSAYKTIFLRMLSNNLESTGNNFFGVTGNSVNDYYASPTLYFSVFIIVFIIIYYATLIRRIKDRFQCAVRIVAGMAVIFLIFDQLGSATFNAFVATFGRYSYLLMPIFAIVTMTAMDEMKNMQKIESIFFGLSTFGTFGVIALVYHLNRGNGNTFYYFIFLKLEIIITFLAVIVALLYHKCKKKYCILAFSLLIFGNVTLDSYVTVDNRIFCDFSRDLVDEDDDATMDALKYVENKDTSMYRLEKNYYDLIYYHDAYFEGYHGISTYNSTLNGNVKEFYRMYCNPAINFYSADSFWYSFLNVSNDITQNSLLGIRYILSNSTTYPIDKYDPIYTNGDVTVYQNMEAQSFGIFYDHTMKKSQVQELGMNDKEKVLSYAVVLEDEDIEKDSDMQVSFEDVLNGLKQVETEIGIEENEKIESGDGSVDLTMDFTDEIPNDGKTYYLEFQSNLDYGNNMMVYFNGKNDENNLTPYYHRGTTDGSLSELRLLLPAGTKNVEVISAKKDLQIKNTKVLSVDASIVPHNADITVDLIKNNYLKGSVQCESEGYLFLPVPYEKGWNAFVDGKNISILKADSGFMAIKMNNGNHGFELKYHYPGSKIGCVFMMFSLIVLILLFVSIQGRRIKKGDIRE